MSVLLVIQTLVSLFWDFYIVFFAFCVHEKQKDCFLFYHGYVLRSLRLWMVVFHHGTPVTVA